MSRSSEEVLSIVENVRHKKTDGSLYMMGQRMAWMPQSKDTFTISHNYADIKVQKISPDSKDKVQLQVVMHDGSASTFHFTNQRGRPTQCQDREGVKELLQQLLPKFRRKVNSELEEKNRMLQEDPELFQLYKDLVVSGVVTAEEFWANRTKQSNATVQSNQAVGVSAAFLADIKPQADGCNGIKYNLTADIIESIFRTYPAVKQKHAEYVPDKLSETDFWTRFFQSHYFHRDRISFSSKDLFAECAKNDDQEIKEEIAKKKIDSLLDLTEMTDTSTGEGYGTTSEEKAVSVNAANTSLIKRFNQHSTMVLKVCGSEEPGPSSNGSAVINGAGTSVDNTEPAKKRARLKERVEYEDLQPGTSSSGPSLCLTRRDRFLHGPTPVTATSYSTADDAIRACQLIAQDIAGWTPALSRAVSSNAAVTVLGELTPGGALMQGTSQQELSQIIPEDVQQEIRQTYNAQSELLRHFWSCFPTTDKFLEEKVIRMEANLERFQAARLNPLRDKVQQYHYGGNLTGHMEDMLQTAYTKFTNWKTKRMNRKS